MKVLGTHRLDARNDKLAARPVFQTRSKRLHAAPSCPENVPSVNANHYPGISLVPKIRQGVCTTVRFVRLARCASEQIRRRWPRKKEVPSRSGSHPSTSAVGTWKIFPGGVRR